MLTLKQNTPIAIHDQPEPDAELLVNTQLLHEDSNSFHQLADMIVENGRLAWVVVSRWLDKKGYFLIPREDCLSEEEISLLRRVYLAQRDREEMATD